MDNNEYILTQEDLDARVAQTPVERRSDELTASERRAICGSCEHKTTKFGIDSCGLCGCVIFLKAALKFSDCPAGKWVVPEDPNPPPTVESQSEQEIPLVAPQPISAPPPPGHPPNYVRPNPFLG